MEISQIIPHVESLIFASDRPLPMLEIVDMLNNALAFLEDRATLDQIETAVEAIREKYHSEFYAFEVRESGGGYQFLTKKDYYQTVAQLNGEKFLKRLSTAALETLAIIAYKQPISKGEIEHIRGVSSDYSIQKLLEKELIVISGRSEDLPGKPLLYSTSKAFMDYFGLNGPADLPKLREVFDEETVIQPTLINDEHFTHTNNGSLVVSETGELVEDSFIPTVTIIDETASTTADAVEEVPAPEDETPETDATTAATDADATADAEDESAIAETTAEEQPDETTATPDIEAAAPIDEDEDDEDEEEDDFDEDFEEFDGEGEDEDEEDDEEDEDEDEEEGDEDGDEEEEEEEDDEDEDDEDLDDEDEEDEEEDEDDEDEDFEDEDEEDDDEKK
ncbi:SMC-Scp complex subunit ScpB [Chitinophaga agrisoli]|uniref:SMC-Scp complex subunit ScpB n=1 Tax=Chitinophaga agrisoli TaxID=2607653 RepID=A0A5B2VNY3_9BACT|nr:SMC-Scp complex subunit ScpB [Chitinophaga agrisoli]KAA2240831.1 SMC-Scp complex subunit ScpB [Chitinophaga agrisoli]